MSQAVIGRQQAGTTAIAILGAVTFCHFLNDVATSLLPAIYPMLKSNFDLSFAQIGVITLIYQGIASLFQPIVGLYTDHRPQPYSLPFGMTCTLLGLRYWLSRRAFLSCWPARHCSESARPYSIRNHRGWRGLLPGGAHGFAQSLFQVGGNFGNSLAPLIAAFFILPRGQESLAWFALLALTGIVLLTIVGRWYKNSGHSARKSGRSAAAPSELPAGQVRRAIAVLIALIFSKFFYLSSITSYYIFYLMHRFALPTEKAQLCLFVFLASAAVGTFVGGPIGDRIGRKRVIWASILGVLPFTLALPYVGLPATIGLSILIGLVLSSAFSAIVVYAQELMPGRVGMVSGLFFGLAFGMAGIGAAVLGVLADWTSIEFVYRICSFLPLIGLLTAFLPDVRNDARAVRLKAS